MDRVGKSPGTSPGMWPWSNPGTIAIFTGLVSVVVGLAASTGSARPHTTSASTPVPVVEADSTSMPSVRRDAVDPMSTMPSSSSSITSPGTADADLGRLPGRRRPTVSGVWTEGGIIVKGDHAPEVGEVRYFNGRPIRATRMIRMRVTAYSPDHRSCGPHADGITASGYSVDVNGGRLVAADPRLFPFGSLVSVPGYAGGQVVPVLDRGGAIKGARLDVLLPTHEVALDWGVQFIDVMVWEYADGRPIGYVRPRGR